MLKTYTKWLIAIAIFMTAGLLFGAHMEMDTAFIMLIVDAAAIICAYYDLHDK